MIVFAFIPNLHIFIFIPKEMFPMFPEEIKKNAFQKAKFEQKFEQSLLHY